MKNSILFNFTKRSLSANKTRTAVSIVGVVLSTALICGVFTTVTSLHAAMLKRTIAYEGSWSAMSQNVDPKKVDELVASQHTKTAASSTVLSSTRLSGDTYTRSDNGTFQIRTLPQQLKGTADAARGLTITPTITEGSYPSQTNEVVLPNAIRMSNLQIPTCGLTRRSALVAPSMSNQLTAQALIAVMPTTTPTATPIAHKPKVTP